MRTMSISRQIKIQRKQTKNRMVGQTFNPSGITSEQINNREHLFVEKMKNLTIDERIKYWNESAEIRKTWEYSYPWEWCVFQRNFIFNGQVR